jgi:hypothetical protein
VILVESVFDGLSLSCIDNAKVQCGLSVRTGTRMDTYNTTKREQAGRSARDTCQYLKILKRRSAKMRFKNSGGSLKLYTDTNIWISHFNLLLTHCWPSTRTRPLNLHRRLAIAFLHLFFSLSFPFLSDLVWNPVSHIIFCVCEKNQHGREKCIRMRQFNWE